MGLLPLTSVEPESISSPFHMIIRAGYKVSALSVLNLGAYNKANCVFVALITLECMYPRCQHREGSAQRIGSRQLFLNPCLDLQTGARGEGKGAGSWGRLTCRWLQPGWPVWERVQTFWGQAGCWRDCFGFIIGPRRVAVPLVLSFTISAVCR